jgi:hypothetical protein
MRASSAVPLRVPTVGLLATLALALALAVSFLLPFLLAESDIPQVRGMRSHNISHAVYTAANPPWSRQTNLNPTCTER